MDRAADATAAIPLKPISLSWVLRRTALAVLILAVTIGTMAWLIHASIDPALERASGHTTSARL